MKYRKVQQLQKHFQNTKVKRDNHCSEVTSISNGGAVLTGANAVSAAKALLKKYPNAVCDLDLESFSWAKSLYSAWVSFNGNSPQPK